VLDVHRPYAVLDDLSYRISKINKMSTYLKGLQYTVEPEGVSYDEVLGTQGCDYFGVRTCCFPGSSDLEESLKGLPHETTIEK